MQLNHPGRYSYTVQQYVDIFAAYDHVFGLEVINQGGRYNGDWSRVWPGNDIYLWDLLLTQLMPERPIWGIAADDMHILDHLGVNWLTCVVPASGTSPQVNETNDLWAKLYSLSQPNEAVIRAALEQGQYYFSSLGPISSGLRNVNETPVIDSIVVDDTAGTITLTATSGGQPLPPDDYVWVAEGTEVYYGPTVNFRTTPGIDHYVRAELMGQGGVTYTNPFAIDTVGPTLEVSPSQFVRTVHIGDPLADETITVANVGPSSLSYTVESDSSWLSVWPDSGTSAGEADPIELSYLLTGLSAGEHSAVVTIDSPEATNSPQTVSVIVTIETVSPDFDGDGDVDMDDFGFFQSCLGSNLVVSDPAGCGPADFDGNGLVNSYDLPWVMNCLGGANILADPTCDD